MKKSFWIIALLFLLCIFSVYFLDQYLWQTSETEAFEETSMENEDTNLVNCEEGGAIHLDNIGSGYVNIGYGSTDSERYVDDQGDTRQRRIAVLWMWVADEISSDEPTSRQMMRVHVGQVIYFGGYKIEVVDLSRRGGLFHGSYWITLAVTPGQEP